MPDDINLNDTQLIYKGNLIELHKERVNHPNGKHSYFDIVKHPGGAVIAAFNDKNELCVLKQWRHAVQQFVWELPAGCLEIGEAPLLTAQRELEEETGVIAQQWQSLGELLPSPGFSNEVLYLFRARDLTQGTQNLDDAEQLQVYWLPISDIKKMINNNEISDAKTLAVVTKLLLLDLF